MFVCSLLKNPQRLYMEYQRRGQEPTSAVQENIKTKESQIAKLRRGIARLIDCQHLSAIVGTVQ
ncbi:MAG: hypothetical protein V7L23_30205 [Nostoc sp.]|uniref:hypothetical protein n=1 Tax=Nostoc sp. TaxID=1180 RepID=UPI002FF05B43